MKKYALWKKFYKKNNYYHRDIQKVVLQLVPKDASVIEISCRGGELLKSLPNKQKVGVEFFKAEDSRFYGTKSLVKSRKFDYIILNHTLQEIDDVQSLIASLKKISHQDTRIIVLFFNFLWKPILDLTQAVGLRMPYFKEPNWLSGNDIDNFFYLESFERIKSGKRMLLPINISVLSALVNKYLSVLPIFSFLTLTNYFVYRPIARRKESSVSIVIPARNEEGNMRSIFKKIPMFGKSQEIVFVEGHSKDDTYETIKREIKKYKGRARARLYKQTGKGKGDAVRLGFSKATKDILMILDADLTVDPKELPKFYNAIVEGRGDFIMGSRLVYPMESQAMRNLNVVGNKFFSIAFSFLLDQRIKDTLCGTKVLYKSDYKKIEKNRSFFGEFDPFGDYDLIFGASKLNLKIMEIPIRYKDRTYGKTNISRFTHGFLLLQMVVFAAKKLKFI